MHYSLHNKSNCSILSFRAFFCILSRFSRYLAWVLTCWAHIFGCYKSVNKKITRAQKISTFIIWLKTMVKTWTLVPAVPVGAAGKKFLKFGAFFLFLRLFFVSYSPSGGRAADGPEAPLEKIFCYWFVYFKICEIFNEIFKNVSTSELAQPLMFPQWKILRRE